MKISIFHTKNTTRGAALCSMFGSGIEKCGDEVVHISFGKLYDKELKSSNPNIDIKYISSSSDTSIIFTKQEEEHALYLYDKYIKWCDVAIQVCPFNDYKGKAQTQSYHIKRNISSHLKQYNKNNLIIDAGYILNQASQLGFRKKVIKEWHNLIDVQQNLYYSVGMNGIKNHAQYFNTNSPSDRWDELNIDLKPWKKEGKYVLVLGQTHRGVSTQTIDIMDWYKRVFYKLNKYGHKKILFRPHPRLYNTVARESKFIRRFKALQIKYPKLHLSNPIKNSLEDDLKNAYACVAYSTNASAISILQGVPLIAENIGSISHPIAQHNIRSINNLRYPDRLQWCYNTAYAQWNGQEMLDGTCWKHFRKNLI